MTPNDSAPLPVTMEPAAAAVPVAAVPPRRSVRERVSASLFGYVLPILFLTALFMLILYTTPFLLAHWRTVDAHAEAESAYIRRLAELKAEAEQADARLELLDRKVHLTSLGFRELARKVAPVVVNVVNYREATEKDLEKAAQKKLFLIEDAASGRRYVQQSVGSGLIFKPGVILTNEHVIRGADRLRVAFPSGRSIAVEIDATLGKAETDLAIIRLPANLPAGIKEETQHVAEFADSDKDAQVGEWVLAMGSPLGLRNTVTHGIISAKGRIVSAKSRDDDLMELLQTDAAIFPGNSGGPLFDQLGRVVGVNAMIASDTGGNQGIGFAIPSNTAKRVANELLNLPRGFLGVTMEEVTEAQANTLKIDVGAVLVKATVAGGAADKAGIKPGDVILRINKEALPRQHPMRRLRQLVSDLEPGTVIPVEVVRGTERRQIEVTLGTRPANLP